MASSQKETSASRPPNLRDLQKSTTRIRIVDGAVRAFAIKGYLQTSIDDIASEANVSRATFYLHFKSKAELLPELVSRCDGIFFEQYQRLSDIAEDPHYRAIHPWIEAEMKLWKSTVAFSGPVFEAIDADAHIRAQLFPEGAPGISQFKVELVKAGIIEGNAVADIHASVLYSPLIHFFRMYLRKEKLDFKMIAHVIAVTWEAVIAQARKTAS